MRLKNIGLVVTRPSIRQPRIQCRIWSRNELLTGQGRLPQAAEIDGFS
jgi:hypothetical protein